MAKEFGRIRLGGTLAFDPEKEYELCKIVEELNESHRITQFMAHLLRLAFESPEEFGNGKEVINLVNKMNSYGMSPTRYNFFNQITKETKQMKEKIDSIYEMAYNTYMLAIMGKRLGLEEKSSNLLLSTFMLERQTSDLCAKFGINNFNHSFASSKLEDTQKKAEDVMELIINSYDGLIKELKSNATVDIPVSVSSQYIPTVTDIQNNNKLVESLKENKLPTLIPIEGAEDEEIELTEKPVKHEEEAEQKIEMPLPQNEKAFSMLLDDI